MTVSTPPETAGPSAPPAPAPPSSHTSEVVAAAHERLAEGKSLLDAGAGTAAPATGSASDEPSPEDFIVTLRAPHALHGAGASGPVDSGPGSALARLPLSRLR